MRRLVLIFAAGAYFMTATPGQGQYHRGALALGLHAGLQHYEGDLQRSGYGPALALTARYSPFSHLGIWLQSGYSELRDEIRLNQFFTTLLDAKVTLNFMFFPEKRISPYVYGGAGGLRYRAYEGDRKSPLKSNTGENFGGWAKVALAGAGLEMMVTSKWSVFFSGDYHYAFDDGLDGMVARGDTDGYLNARFGVFYNFTGDRDSDGDGMFDSMDADPDRAEDLDGFQDSDGVPEPDNDRDGILDARDRAPNQPEDVDGYQDEDGVPDIDNDNDGIPDVQDASPNQPEDFDGFEDADGKPEADNDGDGILDSQDKAPDAPEDVDGYQDEDGVPDPDNDGDGIPDVRDGAPDQAETFNDYQDEDGIPDTVPWLRPGERIILQGVTFQSGSAKLNSASYQVLAKVAEALKQDPAIFIEIQGFTDNRGRHDTNLRLSLKRANAVRWYLVNKGIAPERLVTTGFGEGRPIAPNDTPEGRRANRRIEIVRIE